MHCLIIDDDPLIANLLEHFTSKLDSISHTTIADSGLTAVNLLNNGHFDIIFLDYHMPEVTGKDLLEIIPRTTPVVMITSNKDFAIDSYNYENIVDFIIKPVDFIRFSKSVNKVIQRWKTIPKNSQNQIFIRDGNELIQVNIDDIGYIKAAANYIQIFLENKMIMPLMSMKEMETKLPEHFQRIHRSTIVNVKKINKISHSDLYIFDEVLGISNSFVKELLQKINMLN